MPNQVNCPSVAVAAYAEPFVAGRRVVIFGDSTAPTAQLLLDRGARLVHVYDHDEQRVGAIKARSASRNISYSAMSASAEGLQERSFDFGVIENLSAAVQGPELLQALARSLAVRGAALVGVPNPEARLRLGLSAPPEPVASPVGYYELYDHVAEHFADIRMLGQLPFVGYAVADFSAEREADISVDTTFIPGGAEEPEWFWALCSQEPVMGEAFSIIQLPLSQVQMNATEPDSAKIASAKVGELAAKLEERERRIAELEAQNKAVNDRAGQAAAQIEQRRQDQGTREALEAAQAQWNTERAALEARVALAEAAAQAVQSSALDEDTKTAAANDVAALEATLQERAALVEQLEQRLVEAERVVGDLVRELDSVRRQQSSAASTEQSSAEVLELKSKLDNLARANAERAALLTSAELNVQELETKLQKLTSAAARAIDFGQSEMQRPVLTAEQPVNGTDLPS